MISPALDLAELDAGWPAAAPPVEPAPARDTAPPDPPSGVRARPATAAPPLPLAEVARRLVAAEDVARRLRAELAERMSPGQRIAVGEREVVFVAARVRGDEVVGRSGVRVERARERR